MLTGPQLGAAIEAARKRKGITKVALAAHFGVKPPSIQDWVKHGTIDKGKLVELWRFFSDVVGPEHWGLPADASLAPTAEEPSKPYRNPDPQAELAAALSVLLGRLPLLDDYTADKVLGALRAATKPDAPMPRIERDLMDWLSPGAPARGKIGKQRRAA